MEEFLIEGFAWGSDELSGLCDRLHGEFERLWAFKSVKGMEPTNNMAERDLRKMVLWRKKSYGTRSQKGQIFVERITSVVESLRKNSKNVFTFLTESVEAFYNQQPAPLITPDLGF